jgi:hypothetical protein
MPGVHTLLYQVLAGPTGRPEYGESRGCRPPFQAMFYAGDRCRWCGFPSVAAIIPQNGGSRKQVGASEAGCITG